MTSILFRGVARRGVAVAGRGAVLAASLSLGACAQVGDFGFGGAAKEPEAKVAMGSQADLEKATAYWAKEAAKNPRDATAALNHARNLKALGRKPEALAALQAAYIFNAGNAEFNAEYGRLALDLGQVNTASQLLERADDPAKPDWRVISGRGVAMAKQGQYKEAIPFFERARELAPKQASILNNLAMAYTMDGQADKAEDLLRQASQMGSDERVKQNLAMVIGLQGKAAETPAGDASAAAEPVVANDLPPPAERPVATPAVAKGAAAPVATAAVTTASPMEPDEIMKAAMKAEAAKNRAEAKSSSKRKAATATVASNDEAPALKPAAR